MRPYFAILVLLAFAGCRADVDDEREVNRAFAELQAEARAAGGVAVLLRPGQEARVEVIDVKSPIYGTGVSIPVKAVPADSTNPVLVIKHVPEFNAATTTDTVTSLAADIRMLELFDRAAVEPALPVSIFLPFTDATTLDHFNLHIGLHDDEADKWSYLRNEFVESGRMRLRGRTSKLGTMVALEGKQPIVRNTTFYRIQRAGKLLCQGELPDDGTSLSSGMFRITGAKTGRLSLKVWLGLDSTYFGWVQLATTSQLEAPSGEQEMTASLSDEESTLTISCSGATVTSTKPANQVRQLTMKDWFTGLEFGAAPCPDYAGHNCVTVEGEAAAKAMFDFYDDADPTLRGQLSIDRSFSTLTWQSLP